MWRNVRTHESVWREGVRCVKAKQRQGFNGNGRTDRASLHWLYVVWFDNGRSAERPYTGYTSSGSTTDARPSVPTAVTRPVLHDNGPPSDRSDSSDTSDSSDSSDTSDL